MAFSGQGINDTQFDAKEAIPRASGFLGGPGWVSYAALAGTKPRSVPNLCFSRYSVGCLTQHWLTWETSLNPLTRPCPFDRFLVMATSAERIGLLKARLRALKHVTRRFPWGVSGVCMYLDLSMSIADPPITTPGVLFGASDTGVCQSSEEAVETTEKDCRGG